MPIEAGKIRNVAVVGHRGTGKTSLVEALLFQAGKTNRLGTIEAGTTVSDWDEDEQRRQMSLSASLCACEWQDRKLNFIDTPGDSGFQADTVASLRVVEGALVVVSGVMGVEVNTARVWNRADELELSRVVYVNMLDRERADFYRVLAAVQEQLSDRCIAIQLPIGAEHELTGVVDLLHNCAYLDPNGEREGDPVPIPDELARTVEEYRTKLLDAVVETDEALMERYLSGEEIPAEDIAAALKNAVTRDEIYPVACGVATKNLGRSRAARPDRRGRPEPGQEGLADRDRRERRSLRLQDGRRSVCRPHLDLPRLCRRGEERHDARQPSRPFEGAARLADDARREGAREGRRLRSGRHRRRREAEGRADRGRARRRRARPRAAGARVPGAGDELRRDGRRRRATRTRSPRRSAGSARRTRRLRLSRDQQTGEELLSGMSQVHVEVAVERARRRFGVEMELHQPRVPYVETIKGEARAHGRYKKQTGGRGQFGDCHIVLEPLDDHVGYEFVDKIVGGVIPQGFRPAVDKGIQEALQHGNLAGAPVQGCA